MASLAAGSLVLGTSIEQTLKGSAFNIMNRLVLVCTVAVL
jgi:hypothetical protein